MFAVLYIYTEQLFFLYINVILLSMYLENLDAAFIS